MHSVTPNREGVLPIVPRSWFRPPKLLQQYRGFSFAPLPAWPHHLMGPVPSGAGSGSPGALHAALKRATELRGGGRQRGWKTERRSRGAARRALRGLAVGRLEGKCRGGGRRAGVGHAGRRERAELLLSRWSCVAAAAGVDLAAVVPAIVAAAAVAE